MSTVAIGIVLIALLFLLLASGLWIAMAMSVVAYVGLQFFTSSPPEVNLFQSFWGASASWTLAALPLFVWMGEILFRTRLSEEMFEGLAPWLGWLPGRLMHVNIIGCGIFAAVSGSSAATCATIGKVALPGRARPGYDERRSLGSRVIAWWSGTLTWANFRAGLMGATRLSCMILSILAGAAFMSSCMAFTGIPRALAEWVASMNVTRYGLLAVLTVIYLILGMLIDGISMIVLTMSIVLPMVQAAGIDLIWFGIFIVILVEIAQVTPPVGFNLFVLQTMSGRDINYVARASIPFFFMMMIALGIVIAFPPLSTWLPDTVIGVTRR